MPVSTAHVRQPSALFCLPAPLRSFHGEYHALPGLRVSNAPRIGEKFQQWTDQDPPLDEMLDSVTCYWFTQSFPRAIYPYRQFFGPKPTFFHNDPNYYMKKPFGYSWHPMELAPIPVDWVAGSGNLVWHRRHTEGGHFAAWEKPEQFVKDMEDFTKEVWPTVK
jgi:microsomal epoxide hydrolase